MVAAEYRLVPGMCDPASGQIGPKTEHAPSGRTDKLVISTIDTAYGAGQDAEARRRYIACGDGRS